MKRYTYSFTYGRRGWYDFFDFLFSCIFWIVQLILIILGLGLLFLIF